jgi:hypothetical protein
VGPRYPRASQTNVRTSQSEPGMAGGSLFDRYRVVSRLAQPRLGFEAGPATAPENRRARNTLKMGHPRTSRAVASGPMAARVPDPSLGVPRTDSRLGEPGKRPAATPRVGPNRCATGPGAASGP